MRDNNNGILTPQLAKQIHDYLAIMPAEQCWQQMRKEAFPTISDFATQALIYKTIYPTWNKIPAPAWFPTPDFIHTTNIASCMKQLGLRDYAAFYRWSVTNYRDFWQLVIKQLAIIFDQTYHDIVDVSRGIELPQWLSGAKLNIAKSCFQASPDAIAIIFQSENTPLRTMTYGELDKLSNRVAHSLIKHGYTSGDAIGIAMTMTPECVAIYLGIIKAGCVVVSIAESFSAEEMAARLKIAHAKSVFTQDYILRANKQLPLYSKVVTAQAQRIIVLPSQTVITEKLRDEDLSWHDFLDSHDQFSPLSCEPNAHITILFSSGTTGDPKAIPWTHTTAIKCGSDAYFHHNTKPNKILAWPTSIGWMMGPWLIFASFLNRATIALYDGAPTTKAFGEFIQQAKVTMLGVVPSLVKAWRSMACMDQWDWSSIELFSSTGECSNTEDMLYLMSLANYQPIIEYCGGTEIGGAYITGTLVQAAAPAALTTPALGLDFLIIDERGNPVQQGEVALLPPSMGLSTELLNQNHHEAYYAQMPTTFPGKILRRHSDQIEHYANGFYRVQGRVDDTMNLGAIKISSAEIERCLVGIPQIQETAAIAINPEDGGPSQLVIYAVSQEKLPVDKQQLKTSMQQAIQQHLNPLFKIHDVVLMDALPRTASNKVMRRRLREWYQKR